MGRCPAWIWLANAGFSMSITATAFAPVTAVNAVLPSLPNPMFDPPGPIASRFTSLNVLASKIWANMSWPLVTIEYCRSGVHESRALGLPERDQKAAHEMAHLGAISAASAASGKNRCWCRAGMDCVVRFWTTSLRADPLSWPRSAAPDRQNGGKPDMLGSAAGPPYLVQAQGCAGEPARRGHDILGAGAKGLVSARPPEYSRSNERPGEEARPIRMLARAAQREFQVLEGIQHPGILRAVAYHEHELGPALVFEHSPGALRLATTSCSRTRSALTSTCVSACCARLARRSSTLTRRSWSTGR